MSEKQAPSDDPFADLFSNLPSPGAGAGADAAPHSRREARAAAEREGVTGEISTQADVPAAPDVPEVADVPAAPVAPPVPAVPAVSAAAAAAAAPPAVPAAPIAAATIPAATTPAAPAEPVQPAPVEPARAAASVLTLDDLLAADQAAASGGDGVPPGKKQRKRGGKGKWIALGIVVVLLGGIAGAGVWAWNTYEPQIRKVLGWEEPKDYEAGLANGEAIVEVRDGDNGLAVSRTLAEAGVLKTPDALYDMLIKLPEQPVFYPGVYKLQLQMTAAAALEALQNPANRLENTTLVREGLTLVQTLEILSQDLGIPLEEFQAATADPAAYSIKADSLEGWLFPAQYTFNPDVTATEVIQRMIDRAVESLNKAGVLPEDRQRILTIASIVQREGRLPEDMYKVSRVIENRLQPGNQETNGLLQMDSTAQYGFGEMHDGTVSSSGEALSDPNLWNTYVHPGLPIGPIANPGDVAIDAAAHPVDGPWYYFVTVNLNTGETVFSTTAREHEAARQEWIKWCRANPDAGC